MEYVLKMGFFALFCLLIFYACFLVGYAIASHFEANKRIKIQEQKLEEAKKKIDNWIKS